MDSAQKRFDPWVERSPGGGHGQLTLVFLLGESHARRSLEGYSPWGHKELDTTERLTLSLHFHLAKEVQDQNQDIVEKKEDLNKQRYSMFIDQKIQY